nr:hypothetical protein BaRGS_009972 [Batillaria attramentaria]
MHDHTPLYEGAIVEHPVKVQAASSSLSYQSKPDWDQVIFDMGSLGWELACTLESVSCYAKGYHMLHFTRSPGDYRLMRMASAAQVIMLAFFHFGVDLLFEIPTPVPPERYVYNIALVPVTAEFRHPSFMFFPDIDCDWTATLNRFLKKIRNEELWERAGQEPVAKQILRRNLYPGNEGYSLMLRARSGVEAETIKLPYESVDIVETEEVFSSAHQKTLEVEKFFKAAERPSSPSDNLVLVEEHRLERDPNQEHRMLACISIFRQRLADGFVGRLYLDHDFSSHWELDKMWIEPVGSVAASQGGTQGAQLSNINIASIGSLPQSLNIQGLGISGVSLANLGLQHMQVSLSMPGIAVPVPITMINTNPSLLQNQTGILVSQCSKENFDFQPIALEVVCDGVKHC